MSEEQKTAIKKLEEATKTKWTEKQEAYILGYVEGIASANRSDGNAES